MAALTLVTQLVGPNQHQSGRAVALNNARVASEHHPSSTRSSLGPHSSCVGHMSSSPDTSNDVLFMIPSTAPHCIWLISLGHSSVSLHALPPRNGGARSLSVSSFGLHSCTCLRAVVAATRAGRHGIYLHREHNSYDHRDCVTVVLLMQACLRLRLLCEAAGVAHFWGRLTDPTRCPAFNACLKVLQFCCCAASCPHEFRGAVRGFGCGQFGRLPPRCRP